MSYCVTVPTAADRNTARVRRFRNKANMLAYIGRLRTAGHVAKLHLLGGIFFFNLPAPSALMV